MNRRKRRWRSSEAVLSPQAKRSADHFTGAVRIGLLFNPPEPARIATALVTFEPGARRAWHTRSLDLTLIVTAGCGWVQREGGPIPAGA